MFNAEYFSPFSSPSFSSSCRLMTTSPKLMTAYLFGWLESELRGWRGVRQLQRECFKWGRGSGAGVGGKIRLTACNKEPIQLSTYFMIIINQSLHERTIFGIPYLPNSYFRFRQRIYNFAQLPDTTLGELTTFRLPLQHLYLQSSEVPHLELPLFLHLL